MGVGRRRLAPLWALALTLACAQHTGKVPADIPRPAVTGAWSPCRPQFLGWPWHQEGSKQLRGLARGSEKLRVSVGHFSCSVPAPGDCGVGEALLGLQGPGGGRGGVSRASVSSRLQGAILRGLSHRGRRLPACFPGHSWALQHSAAWGPHRAAEVPLPQAACAPWCPASCGRPPAREPGARLRCSGRGCPTGGSLDAPQRQGQVLGAASGPTPPVPGCCLPGLRGAELSCVMALSTSFWVQLCLRSWSRIPSWL